MVSQTNGWWLALVAVLLLSGCAGLDPYTTEPVETSTPGVPDPASRPPGTPLPAPGEPAVGSVPAPPVAPRPTGPAAHLLADAQRLSARREFDRASAQIERALRIERDNPWLYLALADIRLAQRDPEQAQIFVERARSLSRGDPNVLQQARALSLRNPGSVVAP